MNYFKHKTDMSKNPLMRKAVHKHGGIAIAIWCVFLEEVCRWGSEEAVKPRSKTKTWKAVIDVQQIALSCSQPLQKSVASLLYLCDIFGVSYKLDGTIMSVSYPKILEIRDEYSRKKVRTLSGQTPDIVRPIVRVRDYSKSKNKTSLSRVSELFSRLFPNETLTPSNLGLLQGASKDIPDEELERLFEVSASAEPRKPVKYLLAVLREAERDSGISQSDIIDAIRGSRDD